MTQARRIIFSGAPGAGKTTLLDILAARGHCVLEESARAIIRERLARKLPPRPAPREFAAEVMRRDVDNFRKALTAPGPVFFDRAMPDAMCMLDQAAPLERRRIEALAGRFAYHPQVFMFPPWEAIYCTDAERDQTFADAIEVFRMLCAWYRRCGYEVVEMPLASPDERCDFVLKMLDQGKSVA